jgi:DNA-binding Lrp family transcriptional regulator
MAQNNFSSFDDRYGSRVLLFGFTQIPNILIRKLKELDISPTDLSIILYVESYEDDSFHAVSSIANALNLHPNTIRTSIRKMEKMHYLKRIYNTGSASHYDFSGLRSKIRAYSITVGTPAQNKDTPLHKIYAMRSQNLYTNKEEIKNKDFTKRFNQISAQRKKRGYN